MQQAKYQLNVCGEGGEYESLTLDCPLFKKRIVMYVHSRVDAWQLRCSKVSAADGAAVGVVCRPCAVIRPT